MCVHCTLCKVIVWGLLTVQTSGGSKTDFEIQLGWSFGCNTQLSVGILAFMDAHYWETEALRMGPYNLGWGGGDLNFLCRGNMP